MTFYLPIDPMGDPVQLVPVDTGDCGRTVIGRGPDADLLAGGQGGQQTSSCGDHCSHLYLPCIAGCGIQGTSTEWGGGGEGDHCSHLPLPCTAGGDSRCKK